MQQAEWSMIREKISVLILMRRKQRIALLTHTEFLTRGKMRTKGESEEMETVPLLYVLPTHYFNATINEIGFWHLHRYAWHRIEDMTTEQIFYNRGNIKRFCASLKKIIYENIESLRLMLSFYKSP